MQQPLSPPGGLGGERGVGLMARYGIGFHTGHIEGGLATRPEARVILPATPENLAANAKFLAADWLGTLAADESTGTCNDRFDKLGIPLTEEARRQWRELLVANPGLSEFINAVILYDETFYQKTSDGIPFPQLIAENGMITNIKVDKSLETVGEEYEVDGVKIKYQLTKGLGTFDEPTGKYTDEEEFRAKLREYRDFTDAEGNNVGAKAAKWRMVVQIDENGGTNEEVLQENARRMAHYARICQEEGLVPYVEPEILINGTHDIDTHQNISGHTLQTVFAALAEQNVQLDGMILKTGMILDGDQYKGQKASSDEIAERTLDTYDRYVPQEVPAIVALSGGQSDEAAVVNLDSNNRLLKIRRTENPGRYKWRLGFSYGRSLQRKALEIWRGQAGKVAEARTAGLKAAHDTAHASAGEFATAA